MHYLIRLLTTGADTGEARANALAYADTLVDQGEFDWYDPDSARTHKLASELGKKAVEGALARNRDEFMHAIHVIRLMLRDFTDEQIYQEQFDLPDGAAPGYYASRYQFEQAGDDGPVYVYGDHDVWGGKIMNDRQYQDATDSKDGLWVTSVKFHN
jgi:hypothetical protein